jgi:hypothetical protein
VVSQNERTTTALTQGQGLGQGQTTTTSTVTQKTSKANDMVFRKSNLLNYNSNQSELKSSTVNAGRKSMMQMNPKAKLVSVTEGQAQLIGVSEGQGVVVGFNKKESYVTDIRTREGETKVVQERELERTVRRSVMHKTEATEQEVIHEKVEKIVEIVKNVPVPVEKYVDVEVEIIVDIPIERIIEKEKIIEKVIEVPEERIIEVPIEQIVEKPMKKVYEIDVEVPKYVEVVKEKKVRQVVKNPVEKVNYSYRTIDVDEAELFRYRNQQNTEILQTNVNIQNVDKVVEVPKERVNVIEEEVPVYVDKYINVETFRKSKRRVDVPITVEVEKQKVVDVPVPYEVIKKVDREVIEEYEVVKNVIEEVPVEKIEYKEVEYETEKMVEVPVYVDNIIEVEKEKIVEVPVEEEYIVEVPVENIVENEIEIVRIVEVPVEKVVQKDINTLTLNENRVTIDIEQSNIVDRNVTIENKNLNIVTIPVEKEILKESYVETTVEVPRERIEHLDVELFEEEVEVFENENVVEVPTNVDVEVERNVEEIVVNTREVNKDKVVDVDVTEVHEVPVENRVYADNLKTINTKKSVVNTENKMSSQEHEQEDTQVTGEIQERSQRLNIWREEGVELRRILNQKKELYESYKRELTSHSQKEMLRIMRMYEEKLVEYKNANELRNRTFRKSTRRSTKSHTQVKETSVTINPKIAQLKRRLTSAIQQNNRLCEMISNKSEGLRKSLRRD